MNADRKVLATLIDEIREEAVMLAIDEGRGPLSADYYVRRYRYLATQQAQPPTAQRQDERTTAWHDGWNADVDKFRQAEQRRSAAHGASAAVEAVASDHVRRLVGKLDQWRMCMSHSDSYVGEPAGLFKSAIHELARAVDPIYPEQKDENPFPGVVIYTDEHPQGVPANDLIAATSTQQVTGGGGVDGSVTFQVAALHPEQAKDGAAG